MKNSKNLTNSQLRWLAESLTNEQVAALLEDGNQPDINAGVPQNPGMQTVDSKGAMKPQAEQASPDEKEAAQKAQAGDKSSKVLDAIYKGSLSKTTPEQVKAFMKQSGISTEDVKAAVKKFTDWVGKGADVDADRAVSIVKSVSVLLTLLRQDAISEAKSIIEYMKGQNVDAYELVECIRSKRFGAVFTAGSKALHESLDAEISSLVEHANALVSRPGMRLTEETKKALNESIKSMRSDNNLVERIDRYYKEIKSIKNLRSILENVNVKTSIYDKIVAASKDEVKAMNEALSALKYSVAYYKKNKKNL